MPGHKRQSLSAFDPYKIDITDIDGFDNLHHATGILQEAQERAARLFHAKETFYLVNGSTCGILAAICALTKKQDKILIARNCHKAVYHAALLNELSLEYVYPKITSQGVQGSIDPIQIADMMERNPDIKAVVITSPTYDGVISDIKTIAKIVHQYNIPILVDEAHGSHLGFHSYFPNSALSYGADIVIHSLHKTFPSFTQTALLHINSDLVREDAIKTYLGIFETSSPSYILMAGMEKCIRYLEHKKAEVFIPYVEKLVDFKDKMQALSNIKLLSGDCFLKEEVFSFDPSKLLLSVQGTDLYGNKLMQILQNKYNLQLEMASRDYATALTSIMDTKEGFQRLYFALREIDSSTSTCKHKSSFVEKIYQKNKKSMELYQAVSFPYKQVDLTLSEGEISAEYIYLYPPGIPFLVPGEIITKQLIEDILYCEEIGLAVEGMKDIRNKRINIVNF